MSIPNPKKKLRALLKERQAKLYELSEQITTNKKAGYDLIQQNNYAEAGIKFNNILEILKNNDLSSIQRNVPSVKRMLIII